MAAHSREGRWLTAPCTSGSDSKEGYLVNDTGHPVVYAALHRHASYPRPGVHHRGLFGLLDDVTADHGYR